MSHRTQVLLVEDTDEDAALFLRAADRVDVVRVEDAGHAWRLLSDERFVRQLRLLVLDIKLPGESGLELLARIKGDAQLRRLPAVVFSSSKATSDVSRAYALGAASYVVKPIQFRMFREVVETMVAYWSTVNEVSA